MWLRHSKPSTICHLSTSAKPHLVSKPSIIAFRSTKPALMISTNVRETFQRYLRRLSYKDKIRVQCNVECIKHDYSRVSALFEETTHQKNIFDPR